MMIISRKLLTRCTIIPQCVAVREGLPVALQAFVVEVTLLHTYLTMWSLRGPATYGTIRDDSRFISLKSRLEQILLMKKHIINKSNIITTLHSYFSSKKLYFTTVVLLIHSFRAAANKGFFLSFSLPFLLWSEIYKLKQKCFAIIRKFYFNNYCKVLRANMPFLSSLIHIHIRLQTCQAPREELEARFASKRVELEF